MGGEIQGFPAPDSVSQEMISGATFWDKASQAGKRVCVINPLLAYPAWSVNGVMLTMPPPGTRGSATSITPREEVSDTSFPEFPATTLTHSSARHPGTMCEALHALTLRQAEYGLELFQREPWDIFYQQFAALDYVEHTLWRYSDPGDTTHPGRNKHSGRIQDFYRLFDTIIGQFRLLMEANDVLLVVSAHGHGRRCRQSLNLNEWLRNQNFLTTSTRSTRVLHRHYLRERAKHHTRALLEQGRGMKTFPHMLSAEEKRMLHYTAHLIEPAKTVAQVVALAGGSSFGGIALNRECMERNGTVYEEVRTDILQRLRQLRLKGRPVVYWADVREAVYAQGPAVERYPDILFELHNEYGVGSAIYVPLLTTVPEHRWISGEHRMSGVFLLGKLPPTLKLCESVKEPTVMDVAPIVLQLVGVTTEATTLTEKILVASTEAALP